MSIRESISQACEILFEPGQTTEVRLLGKRGTASGYFDDVDKLCSSVIPHENQGYFSGIYVTLNPVNPDLLARRANRIETRLGKDERSAGDADIVHRRWLPIDIDPVRPSGVSSSHSEHQAACAKATEMVRYLQGLGWPDPVMADSGNGAHLLYRISLPNDESATLLVKQVLSTLHLLFSDKSSVIDTSVYNAARIWKLYGTTSRKGDDIPSRPHRTATLLSVPDTITEVSGGQLSSLAGMLPAPLPVTAEKNQSSGEPIDLGSWLAGYGIGFQARPYADGTIFLLDSCPFSHDHQDGAYAIQFASGAIFAGCHHQSCGGKTQRWSDLRRMYEQVPTPVRGQDKTPMREKGQGHVQVKDTEKEKKSCYGSGKNQESLREQNRQDMAQARMIADQPSEEVCLQAASVLYEGDPLSYMLNTFGLDHTGDSVVAQCLVMSLASRIVINAKGLHVSVTGESGKGKSHAFETMMLQVPEELRLEGRMSDKALFYIRDMQPGTVIILDDISLSDTMQEILKGVTTSFRRPFKYRTVNKDRSGETCVIPERCVWWVAKVDGTGDDQVWNRMLTCWIDDSAEQDARVLARTLQEAACVQQENQEIRQEIVVCQEIWRSLQPVRVVVPFAEQIRFSSSLNRRNPDMLLDMVRAHAALMQHQREKVSAGGMVQVLATVEDFDTARRLFLELNGDSGGQQSKLTRKEAALIEALRMEGQHEITIARMQRITGRSHSVIYKMLHGSVSKGHHYEGLLEKCPAISVCDRTRVTDENGAPVSYRRTKAYHWDSYVYDAWASDGGCWLEDRSDPGTDSGDGGDADGGGMNADVSATNSIPNTRSEPEYLNNSLVVHSDCGNDAGREQGNDTLPDGCGLLSEPHHSATQDPGEVSEGDERSDPGSGAVCHDQRFRNMPAIGGFIPQQPDDSAGSDPVLSTRITQRQIRTKDFTSTVRGVGPGPCDCCGSSWVHYQERMTSERLSGPRRFNRKICRQCYETARRAEAGSIRALPGVITTAAMTRLDRDLGRCQVCEGQAAVWFDQEQKVAICEGCYQRESGETWSEFGGVL